MVVDYIAVTNRNHWGRGSSITKALANAGLSSSSTATKVIVTVVNEVLWKDWRIDDIDGSVTLVPTDHVRESFTQEQLQDLYDGSRLFIGYSKGRCKFYADFDELNRS